MAGGLMDTSPVTRIPAQPDLGRMRRERTERVRSIMRTQGIDALVLLGNTNVIYATGAVWPLADSGRTHFEQPVAVVLADDEFPHIWSPVHDDERLRAELPADHLHGPVYLDFDEGVAVFAAQLAALDEHRGRHRRRRVDPCAPTQRRSSSPAVRRSRAEA